MPQPRAIIACLALAALPAAAQVSPLLQPPWPRLQQGFEDAEPLARSLEVQQRDLRSPTGFEHVYDLGDGRLARIDGNLIAVFPRSTYSRGSDGLYPTIPPGTTFYIGLPPGIDSSRGPDSAFTRGSSPASLLRGPDRRAGRSALTAEPITRLLPPPDASDPPPRHTPIPAPTTMFNNDGERQRIINDLMLRARRARER